MISRKNIKILISLIMCMAIGIVLLLYFNFNRIKIPKVNSIYRKNVIAKEQEKITNITYFPDNVYGVPVKNAILSRSKDARPCNLRNIHYIVIHETGNFAKGVGAKNHAMYLNRSNDTTSWHYTVDDKEIYHHIPDNEVAYHAADELGNLHGIGIELCVNQDGNFEKTFDNAVKLVAYLIKVYDLSIYDIRTHHDFSGKNCPHIILRDNRFDEFKNRVKSLLQNSQAPSSLFDCLVLIIYKKVSSSIYSIV